MNCPECGYKLHQNHDGSVHCFQCGYGDNDTWTDDTEATETTVINVIPTPGLVENSLPQVPVKLTSEV